MARSKRTSSATRERGRGPWRRLALRRLVCAALLVAAAAWAPAPGATPRAGVPQGVWLFEGKAAVEIFNCGGLMCGRILWLRVPRNALGQLDRDKHNPDPALRQRQLCGVKMIWSVQPDGPGRWRDGWFYNPDDGQTYRVAAQLADDTLIVRIYKGVPFFGETKMLVRVAHGVSDGWC